MSPLLVNKSLLWDNEKADTVVQNYLFKFLSCNIYICNYALGRHEVHSFILIHIQDLPCFEENPKAISTIKNLINFRTHLM